MTYQKYDFTDPTLDYDTVFQTVQEMYADLYHSPNPCCKPKSIASTLCEVDTILQCVVIDQTDVVRYQSDVKSAYLLLYPLV